ncbi:MAG TPA: hypothetical protein VK540_18955 [Polyangiaceae bacterium]|nr:hypothetical protein [Polyangiaceae bacterium]
MIRKASSSSCFARWGIAAGVAGISMMQATPALAEEVSATGKGIVGGALLGGEVVMLVEAAFGVKSGWVYVLSGVLGAGAGGFGGSLIEKDADAKVSVYMLAGGMALVIPTTVAVLQATSYSPPEDYTEDKPSAPFPASEPPKAAPGGPSPTGPSTPAPGPTSLRYHWKEAKLKIPVGLLDLEEGAFKVAVPAVELRPLYRPDELQKYGLEQKHELRVPVFSATF